MNLPTDTGNTGIRPDDLSQLDQLQKRQKVVECLLQQQTTNLIVVIDVAHIKEYFSDAAISYGPPEVFFEEGGE